MKRIALTAAIAVAALTAGAAHAQLAGTLQSQRTTGIPMGGPYVPPGSLYDNEQSDGITSLASQNSSGTLTARTADDFIIPAGSCASGQFDITNIRTQMVQADAAPQPFAVDLYNDDGTGNSPVAGITPFVTVAQSTQTLLGAFGVGTSIFEASFVPVGLVLNANTKYWISSFGATAASNPSGFNNFFATSAGLTGTTDNGVIIAPGAGVAAWTPVHIVIGGSPLAFSFAIDGTCRLVEADLAITKTNNTTTLIPGGSTTYTLVASNLGPAPANDSTVTDTFPAPLTGCTWTCVGASGGACTAAGTGNINDTNVDLPVGGTATYTATCSIPASATGSIANTATVATNAGGPNDPNAANNSATDTDTLTAQADLSIVLTDAPDPVTAGQNLTYTATATNGGLSDAQNVAIALTLPANTTLVSASGTGATCAGTTCTFAGATAPGATRVATYVVTVAASVLNGTVLTGTAAVSSPTTDPNPANNSASTTTNVIAVADLAVTLNSPVTQVLINVPVTFTAVSTNNGPSDAQNVSVTITLSPDFRYSSHTANGATCTTPQIGNTGAVTCTWPGATIPGATRTLTVVAYSNVEGNTSVSASTTSATTDPVANNNAATLTVTVGYPFNEIPTLSGYALALLGLLLGLMGFVAVRRQG